MITEETKSVSIIEKLVERFKTFQAKIVIKSNDEYQIAGESLKQIKEAMDKIDEFFNDDIDKAFQLHRSLTGKKKMFKDPLVAAEANLKNGRIIWFNDQDRLRKIEQDKLDAVARKKEEDEKKKLDDKIKKAEEKGDTATAEMLQEKKDQTVVLAPQAASRVEKTDGIKMRKVWVGEVTDMKLLVKSVASGLAPISILDFKQAEINAMAKAYKGSMQIEGLRFYEKTMEAV